MGFGYDPMTGKDELYGSNGRSYASNSYRRDMDLQRSYSGGGSGGSGSGGNDAPMWAYLITPILFALFYASIWAWSELRESGVFASPPTQQQIEGLADDAVSRLSGWLHYSRMSAPYDDLEALKDSIEGNFKEWRETHCVPEPYRWAWQEATKHGEPLPKDPAVREKIDAQGYEAMTRLFESGRLQGALSGFPYTPK